MIGEGRCGGGYSCVLLPASILSGQMEFGGEETGEVFTMQDRGGEGKGKEVDGYVPSMPQACNQ